MADLAVQLTDAALRTIVDGAETDEQRRARELDEKFARVAAANAAQVDAKRAKGEPVTLREHVDAKVTEFLQTAKAAIEHPPERILRLEPSEGDQPAAEARRAKLRAALIPARFYDPEGEPPFVATLDNYIPKTRHQQTALDAARFWLDRARAGKGCMLALVGPQGTGKSHLLYACANALLDADVPFYARPWYTLADELRYGGEHPITKSAIDAAEVRRTLVRPWSNAKTWLLDEIRPTSGTAFDDMELTKLFCHAYDARHPVIITTNVNPLAEVMGAAAASRFNQVVIDGPDARRA